MSERKQIVILDHDDINAFIIENLLKHAGFKGKIISFYNLEEAISHVQDHGADILFIDHYQNEANNFRILEAIRPMTHKPSVVVLWDYNESDVRELSNVYPIAYYFRKPLKQEEALICTQFLSP